MRHVARVALLTFVLVATAGCARNLYGPSLDTSIRPAPRAMDELTLSERRGILDRAEIWRPIATERLNLLAGPDAPGKIEFDANVTCAFHYPDAPLEGVTPKFECEVAPGDVVKVKYGESNGEVYAEVAATRLFWALGFMADRMYPVKVTCLNCPADPHRASSSEWRLGRPGNVSTRTFDPAIIERKFPGKKVAVPGFEGWSWRELDAVALNTTGAPLAHSEALQLLAAFIQHVDSKPRNQALLCADGGIAQDADGNATCSESFLVVKDLGSSFAHASKIRFAKMKLESWRSVPIWKNERTCQANLTSSIVGTLAHPHISEVGRKFLADRLALLSDDQLRDLFTAARVERRGDTVEGRPVTVDDWVRAFKDKRAQITNHHQCPA
jgi:hypothetical protein